MTKIDRSTWGKKIVTWEVLSFYFKILIFY